MTLPPIAVVRRPDPHDPTGVRTLSTPVSSLSEIPFGPDSDSVPAPSSAAARDYKPSGPRPIRVRFDLGEAGTQQAVYSTVTVGSFSGPPILLLAFPEAATGYLPPVRMPPREPITVTVDGHPTPYRVYNVGMAVVFAGHVLVQLPLAAE